MSVNQGKPQSALAGGGGSTPISSTPFTTSGTMTVAPDGENFKITVTGGGASGGTAGGGNDSTARIGGVGGGGAARTVVFITRAELIAALPITVTVGAGGAEPGDVVVPGFSSSNGLDGLPGGESRFGNFATAFGGAGGENSTSTATPRAGGPGGGRFAVGVKGPTTSTGGGPEGQAPLAAINNDFPGIHGGQGSHRDMVVPPFFARYGGAAGANVNITPANPADRMGGISEFGGGGGGGGGSFDDTPFFLFPATEGGQSGLPAPGVLGGGGGAPGATPVAGVSPGNDGSDGPAGTSTYSGGGGGGGSLIHSSTNDFGISGKGGAGGIPGGGGGGGGHASKNNGAHTVTARTGGAGARGEVLVEGLA